MGKRISHRIAQVRRSNRRRILTILLLTLAYLPWFAVVYWLALQPIGCNAYDPRKAFGAQPTFILGQLEVFVPVSYTRQETQLVFDALASNTASGARYDGHWVQFYARQAWSIRGQRVQVFVCDTQRLNGVTRSGVLGYTEFPDVRPPAPPGPARVYVVAGEWYELPDLYVQLHHAFRLNTDQWYQDQTYWAIVRGQGEGICEAIKLARGWVP